MNSIEVKNLYKNYDNIQALKGISFTVKKNSFFALLGPNGAGKSTTINIICTLLDKTSGDVFVEGHNLDKNNEDVRANIGVVFQEHVLDEMLSVEENIYVRGSLYHLTKEEIKRRIRNLTKIVDIEPILQQKYGKLSGGQKRRADIARALINHPKILILDEPTTGLDPQSRKKVWELIQILKEKYDMTIFLTTHYMEETQNCDNIIIIDEGIIIAEGTPEELKLNYSYDSLYILPLNLIELQKIFDNDNIIYQIYNDMFKIKIDNSLDSISILNNYKQYIKAFEVKRGNMDDVFINITGKQLTYGG